jgi:nucleotide-binding universal stress UspA family protein
MAGPDLASVDDLTELVRGREQLPSTRLRLAIALGRELSDTGDALIERFVAEARAAELSWTEIGRLFGTSKQAAQKRYGAAAAGEGRPAGRLAHTAHDVLEQAGQHARELGHNYVGTEHALFVLATGGHDPAAQVLADLGVTRDRLLAQLGPLTDPRPYERLAVMPRFKQALEYAAQIADRLGQRGPSTEHVLAGIVAVPDSMAVRILECLGVSPDDVRAALAARLGVGASLLVVTHRRRRRLLARTSC